MSSEKGLPRTPAGPPPASVPLVHPRRPARAPRAPFGGGACCARGPRAARRCWGAACSPAPPAGPGSSAPGARTPPSSCSRAEAGRRSCRRQRQSPARRRACLRGQLSSGDGEAGRRGGAGRRGSGAAGGRLGAGAASAEPPGLLLEPGREAHGAGLRFLLPLRPPSPETLLEQHRLAGPGQASGRPAQSARRSARGCRGAPAPSPPQRRK